MIEPAQPWHMPVRLEDIPETGLHFDLVADEHVRAGLAALAGVPEMPRLEAAIDVARYGSGLRATGRVSATVGQTCVVTLEPMENQVDESIDVIFAPSPTGDVADQSAAFEADEPPAVLSDGTADLGGNSSCWALIPIPASPVRSLRSPPKKAPRQLHLRRWPSLRMRRIDRSVSSRSLTWDRGRPARPREGVQPFLVLTAGF